MHISEGVLSAPVIVHQKTANAIQPVKRTLVQQNTEGISSSDVIGISAGSLGLWGSG